jgi:hypothetical protein
MQSKSRAAVGGIRSRLTYANVMVTILAFFVLGGAGAYAAGQIGKDTVGSRQLKSKAVTTGKVAPNAINGSKVADGSLTGADIKLSALGTVPAAETASSAGDANTVGGHAAACPTNTILIRGTCFDSKSNGEAPNLLAAADRCAAKNGYLPTPVELYEAREVLYLGSGIGTEKQFTNSYYYDASTGNFPSTVTVDGKGVIAQQGVETPAEYTCAYSLVR